MSVDEISPRALKAMIDARAPLFLLDVRQPWEHERARLDDHALVPLDELDERASELRPPDGALVVAYCHHGVRSVHAAAILARAGFRAASLAGGIDRWSLEIDPAVPRY